MFTLQQDDKHWHFMQSEIIYTTGKIKSICLTESELWVSDYALNAENEFIGTYIDDNWVRGSNYKLQYFKRIIYRDDDNTVLLVYRIGGMVIKIKLSFEENKSAAHFAETLAAKLGLSRTSKPERNTMLIATNLAVALIVLLLTYLIAGYKYESSTVHTLNTSGFFERIVEVIFRIIGKSGLLIVCFLLNWFYFKRLYQMYRHSGNIVVLKEV